MFEGLSVWEEEEYRKLQGSYPIIFLSFARVKDTNMKDAKKVIILMDEYDTPLQEAWIHGYWNEMVGFIRNLFNSTFKTNPYLERVVMTRITRVSRESIFSDLNHLKVITTTSNKYETSFGFTREEVFQALEEFGLSEEKEGVKQWKVALDGMISC